MGIDEYIPQVWKDYVNKMTVESNSDDPRETIDVCPECEVGTLFEVGLDYAGMESNDMVTVYECEYCNHQVRMQPKPPED